MKSLATALALAVAFGSAAFADQPKKKAPRIAFLAGVVDATYTPAQKQGLEEGSGGEITIFNPEFDPTAQLRQCQDAITSQRYDAIVITPLDNATSIPCAKAAHAAGIPLIVDGTSIGKDPDELKPQVEGVFGSAIWRPATAGEYTWNLIAKICEGHESCKILIEVSYISDPLFKGQIDYIKKKAEGTNVEIVAIYESQYDPAQTTAKLRDLLVAHPDVNIVTFVADPTAMAGLQVIKSLGMQDQIKEIAQGGTKAGATAVKSGELFATFSVLPFTVSRIEGEMALKAINGEPIEPNGIDAYAVGNIAGAVTMENVDQYKPEW
ncbi:MULTISPECIES: sugar ABC transporter substrate-binding protein [Rhizobium]|uniref:sugar ABC transporter substrate-binding protein n=1 Tax=Rhizobium TaxID=379 RepID=UPI00195A445B|nr:MULTISPECIES: sugar ABC transporter substrate-binding protein [Rhizobium]MBM7044931.1 sugar ABC transporter substrate-binding protein [Rhizobium lusitanum]